MNKKIIAIVGPESTGKSALAHALADKLKGCIVDEIARSYIDDLGRPYCEEDLLVIAKLQIAEEDKFISDPSCHLLICDTNLLVIKIWSLHKYRRCHPWIENELRNRKYDLHLLNNIDLSWQEDKQREHPTLREFFFNWYHKELIDSKVSYEILTGQGESRLNNALNLLSPGKEFE